MPKNFPVLLILSHRLRNLRQHQLQQTQNRCTPRHTLLNYTAPNKIIFEESEYDEGSLPIRSRVCIRVIVVNNTSRNNSAEYLKFNLKKLIYNSTSPITS